jgi:hypothetical protein
MSTIVIKSLCGFLNHTSTEYSKLEIIGDKVIDTELSKSEALELIKDLKEIHRIDHNNIIWGDEDFKEKCPEYFRLKINNESPKKIIFDDIVVNFRTHSLIIKENDVLMRTLQKYLSTTFSDLYKRLGKHFVIKNKRISFEDYDFFYDKFNIYQKTLINLYKFKYNFKRFSNEDLDDLVYTITDLGIYPELIELANKEISQRIKKGVYET